MFVDELESKASDELETSSSGRSSEDADPHDAILRIWRLHRKERENNAITLTQAPVRLSVDDADAVDPIVRNLEGRHFFTAATNGDGACGVHAVFGKPAHGGELRAHHARRIIRRHLDIPLRELREKININLRGMMQMVEASIWGEFVLPCLQGHQLTNEADIFRDNFEQSSCDLLRQQALEQHAANQESHRAKTEARNLLLQQLRPLFVPAVGEVLWTPLAIKRGILPPGFAGFLHMETEEQKDFLLHCNADAVEFLMPVDDMPMVSCKYSALFLDAPAANRYRFSFLSQLYGDAELRSLPDGMLEDIDALEEGLNPGDYERILQAATLHLPEFTAVSSSSGPPAGFVEGAWPILMKAMCTDGYYLSMDELLLLCGVAGQSVAVFEEQPDGHAYRGGIAVLQSQYVLVSLNCQRGTGTRGHYERIVLSSRVAACDSKVHSKNSRRQAQQLQGGKVFANAADAPAHTFSRNTTEPMRSQSTVDGSPNPSGRH